ncbi:MAG: hypothetical protein ACJAVI_003320 [Candidatus Azotimanducaceae bacterium]|jgi:hypothetical protein
MRWYRIQLNRDTVSLLLKENFGAGIETTDRFPTKLVGKIILMTLASKPILLGCVLGIRNIFSSPG